MFKSPRHTQYARASNALVRAVEETLHPDLTQAGAKLLNAVLKHMVLAGFTPKALVELNVLENDGEDVHLLTDRIAKRLRTDCRTVIAD